MYEKYNLIFHSITLLAVELKVHLKLSSRGTPVLEIHSFEGVATLAQKRLGGIGNDQESQSYWSGRE